MSWIDQLTEALIVYRTLVDAARRVVEGEDIWWCEEHVSKGSEPIDGYALCWYAANQLAQNQRSKLERCRVVLMRLIAVPDTEGEEG